METSPRAGQHTTPISNDTFTVVIPEALRERFQRWLRHEHLTMAPWLPTTGRVAINDNPAVYVIAPDRREHRRE